MSQEANHYYIPTPSTWPLTGAIAIFFMGFGAAFTVNKLPIGYASLAIGFAILIYMLSAGLVPWRGKVRVENSTRK